jgi:glycerophosphoryl diester phosphodiesterase
VADTAAGQGRKTQIAAHRGGAGLWAENSMLAFRNAITMDIEFIEFDIHRTRDGVLVVHHDPMLGRTTEGSGAIWAMDWADLKTVRLKEAPNERIPLFEEVLEVFQGSPIRPRLELKNDAMGLRYRGMETEALSALRNFDLFDRTVITSFDIDYLVAAKTAGLDSLLWLLKKEYCHQLVEYPEAFAQEVLARGIQEIAAPGSEISQEMIDTFRRSGVVLSAYAGKDTDFDRLLGIGLSVFTTDRPDLAVDRRAKLALTHFG